MTADFRRWHIRIGVLVALPLAVILCTALALGTLRATHLIAKANGPAVEPSAALARVLSRYKAGELSGIFFPDSTRQPLRIELSNHDETWIDLQTGTETSNGASNHKIIETLYRLHRGKILGLGGQIGFSAVAGAMFFLLLLGWRIRSTSQKKSTHRTLGLGTAWLAVGVMMLGAVLNFGGILIRKYDPVAQLSPAPPVTEAHLDLALASALAAYPSASLVSIHLASKRAPALEFYFEDSSRVFVDPATSRVLKTASWRSHWTRSLFAIHTGRFLGAAQPFWVLIVAGPALALLLTGLVLVKQRT